MRSSADAQGVLVAQSGSLPRTMGRILLVAGAYLVAAEFGLRLALVERNVTPLWPPTGIAVVALLVWGRRIWPGIAVAAFLTNAPISMGLLPAAVTAVGNTLAPVAAAAILERLGFRRELDRLRDAEAIVIAALGGMVISATIGAATLVIFGTISAADFLPAWAVWWTGDAMGVLVVAPFLLSVREVRQLVGWPWKMRVEFVVMLAMLTAVSLAVIWTDVRVMFVVVPLLGWAAWRFQQRGAAPAALIVSVLATWAAAHGLGPFSAGTLLRNMLVLQAFNATVALASFFFAALVAERIRAQKALETASGELEARVRDRTSELSETNERLRHEIAERRTAENQLRKREHQLAEAQQVAGMGSLEWVIQEDKVVWSDELYRIHGFRPQQFEMDFAQALKHVHQEDVDRIATIVRSALRRGQDHHLPPIEYRIVREDGEERVLLGNARLQVDKQGSPLRLVGTVQDITESKRAERQHEIAEVLQRSLLPDRLPEIPGLAIAARYVGATSDATIGGDFYDVVPLPSGGVAMAIGDVVGHGLQAASTMGQLRMAVRAYALDDPSPAVVISRLHRLLERLRTREMATLAYVLFRPESGELRYAMAGHPPPLIIQETGEASYLHEAAGPPLGTLRKVASSEDFVTELRPGSTLLLFTDGLVERRDRPLHVGLERLREVAVPNVDVESLCEDLLSSLLGEEIEDDVALLALRPVALTTGPLRMAVPADPQVLTSLRMTMRRWLRELEATNEEINDVVAACSEACANAIQHAYGGREGSLEIEIFYAGGVVDVGVKDLGEWRPPTRNDWGRGFTIMSALMDTVEVDTSAEGTQVRMRRRLSAGIENEPARAR